MIEKELSNILIIAGTGRNSGKTTLACKIINRIKLQHSIYSIKISPHFYSVSSDDIVLIDHTNYIIIEEIKKNTGKDSSLMLNAGAQNSYFIMVKDEFISEAFFFLLNKIPPNSPVICESGSLRKCIKPGLFFILNKKENTIYKESIWELKEKMNYWITFDNFNFDFAIENIDFNNHSWYINTK